MNFTSCCLITFALTIFSTSIYGLVLTSGDDNLFQAISITRCATVALFQEINYGINLNKNFMGVSGTVSPLTNIRNEIDPIIDSLKIYY